MSNQWIEVREAVAGMSKSTKVFLGLAIALPLAVFVPILCLNLFGVWSGAFAAYGDHLVIAGICLFADLIGIVVR